MHTSSLRSRPGGATPTRTPVTTLLDVTDDVAVISWPEDVGTRTRLAREGVPRLLVIHPGVAPPDDLEDLEDWIRSPVDLTEIAARRAVLRERVRAQGPGLHVDAHGLAWHGGSFVSLSPLQEPLLRHLVGRLGQTVRRDELEAVYRRAGGGDSRRGFDAVIGRMRRRLAEIGVSLHGLSGGRLLLELPVADPTPTSARRSAPTDVGTVDVS